MVKAWSAWILGPAAWALQLSLSYGMVPWLCGPPVDAWLHAVSVVTLFIALIGVALGWRAWQQARQEPAAFIALSGLMLSTLSAFGIFAQAIPGFLLEPCL